MDDPTNTIGLVALVLLAIGVAIALLVQGEKLADPENNDVVYLEQLHEVSLLEEAPQYILKTIRQSGNPYCDDKYFHSASQAISSAISTFKRAKIDYVVITHNFENLLELSRPYHSHRGVKEGRKVGSIAISSVKDFI